VNFRVALSHEAKKSLLRMDTTTRARIQARLRQLSENPFDPRISSALSGRVGVRKSRVGDWRVLFTVDREARLIHVATVAARGQVYKRL